MTTLNITYQGQSADYDLVLEHPIEDAADADIRRIAVELVRSGGVRGLFLPQLAANAFDGFVIDRLRGPDGGPRIYLRPKVPFGAPRARG